MFNHYLKYENDYEFYSLISFDSCDSPANFLIVATNRTDNNHGFKFYFSFMICKSAVQNNTIFAIHKSYNISYNNLVLYNHISS